jgi:uncharacterized protein HemY
LDELPKILILLGGILVIIGLVLLAVHKTPFLGRLPGDILIKRKNFTLSFPLATSLLLSVLISLALYLFNKFR